MKVVLIDKLDREHYVRDAGIELVHAGHISVQLSEFFNGYEWLPWNGDGPCPMPTGYRARVMYRDAHIAEVKAFAGDEITWEHTGEDSDIIYYFPLEAGHGQNL